MKGLRRTPVGLAVPKITSPHSPGAASMFPLTSTPQYRVQSLDDAILGAFVEIRMHRQAENFGAETIRYRQPVPGCRVIAIGGLAVQPPCVIDGGRYACLFELGRRSISPTLVRNTHRVLRPHASKPNRRSRNLYEVLEALVVSSRYLIAGLDLVCKDRQLLTQYCRLCRVESRVHADAHIVVFVAALAVHPQALQHRGDVVIVGEHGAAVAVAAEGFGGEEAGCRNVAQGPDFGGLVDRAKTLRRVADDPQLVLRGDRQNLVVGGRQTEQVDRDDPHRLEPEAPRCRDTGLEAHRVHVERLFEYIDKDRDRIEPADDFGSSGKREGWHEHRLARLDALRHQREPQSVGAVGAAQYVLGAAEGGELLLEDGDLGAHDVFAVVDDTENRLVDAAAEAPPLRAQIDELDRRVAGLKGGGIRHQTISSIRSGPASR